LRVLWARGPSTVRQVHDTLGETKSLGYTTVLKLLQIMTAKGLVRRDEAERAHVYEACQTVEHTKQRLANEVLERVFEGSASQLVMHVLAGRRASQEEIDAIYEILAKHERKRR
jgi:predicted transcriptional regulator